MSLQGLIFTLLPFVGAVPGSILIRKNLDWYEYIKKPSWMHVVSSTHFLRSGVRPLTEKGGPGVRPLSESRGPGVLHEIGRYAR